MDSVQVTLPVTVTGERYSSNFPSSKPFLHCFFETLFFYEKERERVGGGAAGQGQVD